MRVSTWPGHRSCWPPTVRPTRSGSRARASLCSDDQRARCRSGSSSLVRSWRTVSPRMPWPSSISRWRSSRRTPSQRASVPRSKPRSHVDAKGQRGRARLSRLTPMGSASPRMTDRTAIAGVDGIRARRRPALALGEGELGFLLLIGDLCAAAIASYGAPVLWSVFDPDFAPTAGLPAWQLAFPALWALLLRLLGAGDIVTPRFGRRSIASVAQTYVIATTLVLGLFFFVPFFVPRGSSLATPLVAAVVTLLLRFIFLRVASVSLLERRVVVLGTDVAARRAASVLASSTTLRYRLVCFFDGGSSAGEEVQGVPARPLPADLWAALSELDVDLVVVGHTR